MVFSAKTHIPALLDIEVDRYAPESLHGQVVSQLRRLIQTGRLTHGSRLPPSRQLGERLGISRNIVVTAYDQLAGEGLVVGCGRRGSFVRAEALAPFQDAGEPPGRVPALLARIPAGEPRREVALSKDWLPGQTLIHQMPIESWRSACREAGRSLPPAGVGDSQGDPGLRAAIAAWLTENRCVNASPHQIFVTRGTGDFLILLAQALVREGDRCAIEDPGHPVVRQALGQAGGRLLHIAVDEEGIDIARAFGDPLPPHLVHVTPSHQYPMGGRMSGKRRKELVDAARASDTLILENEYGCEFVHEGADYPTLQSMAPEHTILLGTFANSISSSMRLGFAVLPPGAVNKVLPFAERNRTQPSWAAQKIIEQLLVSGDLDKHIRRSRRHYAALLRSIRGRLGKFGDVADIVGDIGGTHVVIRGKRPCFDAGLHQALGRHGIHYQPISALSVEAPCSGGLIFGYGHMDEMVLQGALDLLEASLLEACSSLGMTRPGSL
jgi:GntR family transcriptional regulator/MocR family aminotransferase